MKLKFITDAVHKYQVFHTPVNAEVPLIDRPHGTAHTSLNKQAKTQKMSHPASCIYYIL